MIANLVAAQPDNSESPLPQDLLKLVPVLDVSDFLELLVVVDVESLLLVNSVN